MATVRGNLTEWDFFYKTGLWQRLRKLQLQRHPLCKFCLDRGIVTAAKVVDHVIPHRGNWNSFVTGELPPATGHLGLRLWAEQFQ